MKGVVIFSLAAMLQGVNCFAGTDKISSQPTTQPVTYRQPVTNNVPTNAVPTLTRNEARKPDLTAEFKRIHDQGLLAKPSAPKKNFSGTLSYVFGMENEQAANTQIYQPYQILFPTGR